MQARWQIWTLAAGLVISAVGCRPSAVPISAPTAAKPAASTPAPYLAHAEFSFRIEADGLPAETAEVAFADDYDDSPEEKMRWRKITGLRPALTFDGRPLSPRNAANYRQWIDLKRSEIKTSWTQPGVGDVEIAAKGGGLHATFRVRLKPEKSGTLRGEIAKRAATGMKPDGLRDFYIGFGPESASIISIACQPEYESEITLNARFTHKLSPALDPAIPEIILDGPEADQAAIDNLLFQVTGYSRGLGPFGLTNNRYFGHVFWDADVWVFPALALLRPDDAARIPAYRIRTSEGAAQNFQNWIAADRPIAGDRTLGPVEGTVNAVKFAWESGATGLETAPGDSRFQEHISGSVTLGLQKASALALADPRLAARVEGRVYNYYAYRISLEKDLTGSFGIYGIHGVMSPDEYHIGNNDLYTNLVARLPRQDHSENLGHSTTHWILHQLNLPRDTSGQFLNYEGDTEEAYQQAAGLLAVYPLQHRVFEEQAVTMLDRFGPKVIENGPAMSHSLHALIRARFGDADKAYDEWHAAYDRYAKPPFGYISERPTTYQTVFVTGAAGFLNTVLYGFAGIRVAETPWPDAHWKLPLENGWWISARPNLPSKWTSLTIRDLKILGQSYTLKTTQTTSTLTPNNE